MDKKEQEEWESDIFINPLWQKCYDNTTFKATKIGRKWIHGELTRPKNSEWPYCDHPLPAKVMKHELPDVEVGKTYDGGYALVGTVTIRYRNYEKRLVTFNKEVGVRKRFYYLLEVANRCSNYSYDYLNFFDLLEFMEQSCPERSKEVYEKFKGKFPQFQRHILSNIEKRKQEDESPTTDEMIMKELDRWKEQQEEQQEQEK